MAPAALNDTRTPRLVLAGTPCETPRKTLAQWPAPVSRISGALKRVVSSYPIYLGPDYLTTRISRIPSRLARVSDVYRFVEASSNPGFLFRHTRYDDSPAS